MTLQRTLCLSLVLISLAPAWAAPRIGRLGVLPDAHGYHTGDRVLVPLRGVAEWMGATVDYSKPHVTVRLGLTEVRLSVGSVHAVVNGKTTTLPAPLAVHGGITCVPLRFVAEAFGYEVTYVGHDAGADLQALGFITHVTLRGPAGVARVLLHPLPPDVVAGVLGARERAAPRERPGADYLLHVSVLAGSWAKAHVPLWIDEHGFGQIWRTGVYHHDGETWRQMYFTSRVSHLPEDLEQAGIPLATARALRMEIE